MGFFDVMIAIIIIVHRAGSTCGISCSVLSEHDMTAIDSDGGDHTIEVDRERVTPLFRIVASSLSLTSSNSFFSVLMYMSSVW